MRIKSASNPPIAKNMSGRGDIHQPDLFVIDRDNPVMHDLQRQSSWRCSAELDRGFRKWALSRPSIASLSSTRLLQRYQIGRDRVQIVIIQLHRRHERAGLQRIRILNPLS